MASIALQRQRLLHHVGDSVPGGEGQPLNATSFERVSKALIASFELLKLAERELADAQRTLAETRAARDRWQVLFERAPSALFLTTSDTTIRAMNRPAGVLLHRDTAELVGRTIAGLVARRQQRGFRERLAHVIEERGADEWTFTLEPMARSVDVRAKVEFFEDPSLSDCGTLYWSLHESRTA